jgi:ribosomal protein S15P/S13E
MHRIHAIRLALLCCAIVAVLAACGSGSQVQDNYGSLANEICGKFSDATKGNPTPAQRIQAIEDALAGLQGLHPPDTIANVYTRLLFNFKAAVDILKPNIDTLARLAKHLQAHPDDKRAARQYARITRRIQLHLRLASTDARTLGMGRCQTAFGG